MPTETNIISIKSYFSNVIFIPFVLVIFLISAMHLISVTQKLHTDMSRKANIVANTAASLVSGQPNTASAINQVLERLVQQDSHIISLEFHSLKKRTPHMKSSGSAIHDRYITTNAPVIIYDNANTGSIVGYVNIVLDYEKSRKTMLYILLVEFIASMFMLVCVYFIIFLVVKKNINLVNKIITVNRTIMNGNYDTDVSIAGIKAKTYEMQVCIDTLSYVTKNFKRQLARIEELEQQNAELTRKEQLLLHHQSTFQDLITHEFRTPLNGIGGGLQIFHTKSLDSSQQEAFELIQHSYDHLSGMLDKVIELNQINQGKLITTHQVFNIETVMRSVIESYSHECLQKNIILSLNMRHLNKELIGDERKIRSILDHLISNAVKFTHHGSIKLESTINEKDNSMVEWVFEVIDTGIGISPELHSDIFNAYVQEYTGSNRQYEGSGLGLTLTKKLVEFLGGNIALGSIKHKGSTFSVRLTLQDAAVDLEFLSLKGMNIIHIHSGVSANFVDSLYEMEAQAQAFQDINLVFSELNSKKYDVVTLCSLFTEDEVARLVKRIRAQETGGRLLIIYFIKPETIYNETMLHGVGVDYLMTYTDSINFAKKLKDWMITF